jgi:hypothetical protein
MRIQLLQGFWAVYPCFPCPYGYGFWFCSFKIKSREP